MTTTRRAQRDRCRVSNGPTGRPGVHQHRAASAVTAATKAPTGTRSKRLQTFVDFVTTNGIQPVTKYAQDKWPAKPGEFYAEAFSLWHNDPMFLGSYSAKLKGWFDAGEHLK